MKSKAKSINLKDFKEGNFEGKTVSLEVHPVLMFLKKSKNAHNIASIEKAVKMGNRTVRSALSKLVKKGKISHKKPFFAFKR